MDTTDNSGKATRAVINLDAGGKVMTGEELVQKYAKLVYCKDVDCFWNKYVGRGKYILPTTNSTVFPDDDYRGICTRPELGLSPQQVADLHTRYRVTACAVRTDKATGHLDFTRFPEGGNIPDPVKPDEAYL